MTTDDNVDAWRRFRFGLPVRIAILSPWPLSAFLNFLILCPSRLAST